MSFQKDPSGRKSFPIVKSAIPLWLFAAVSLILSLVQTSVYTACTQSPSASDPASSCGTYAAGIGAVSFLVLIYVMWKLHSQWQRPLQQVTHALEQMAPQDHAPAQLQSSAVVTPSSQVLGLLASVETAWTEMRQGLGSCSQDIDGLGRQLVSQYSGTVDSMERQVNTLQATVKKIDGIVNMTIDSDGAASLADTAANEAVMNAVSGSEAVVEAVTAMQEIQESSRRISDITTLVDGIAFQTNILALNAAVEAARAGDQGRGFAVVAGEVRTLATRSAAAAREIKDLIATSSKRVQVGSEHFDRAGKSMGLVMENLGNVLTHISEIKKTALNQHEVVRQISKQVTEAERYAQEHSSLLQQFSAPLDDLQSESERLQDLANKFS